MSDFEDFGHGAAAPTTTYVTGRPVDEVEPTTEPLAAGERGLFVLDAQRPTQVLRQPGPVRFHASTEPGSGETFAVGGSGAVAAHGGLVAYEVDATVDTPGVWLIGTRGGERVAVAVKDDR